MMLDGVYVVRAEGAAPKFVPSPALQDSDVQRIVELAAHRLVRSLQQRGVLDSTEADALAEEAPLLPALSSASIQGQLAKGSEGLPLSLNAHLHALYGRCLGARITWKRVFDRGVGGGRSKGDRTRSPR